VSDVRRAGRLRLAEQRLAVGRRRRRARPLALPDPRDGGETGPSRPAPQARRPTREDARQGALGDAGLIAVLGAVAHHQPDEITDRIIEQNDGSYLVTLDEARCTETGAVPAGRVIKLAVTPVLPVYDHSPHEPAYAKADTAAWAAIAEKALAGIDTAWTAARRAQWATAWAALSAADANAENPRSGAPPTGYVRLGQGSSAWDHAEYLTHLTGRQAIVRQFPRGRRRIRRLLRRQLAAGKPVIASACASSGQLLPYRLILSHAYEITGVRWRGVILRNPWGFAHPKPIAARRLPQFLDPWYATLA